jgi:hypothetical protein
MTMPTHRQALWPAGAGAIAIGFALLWSLGALQPADARPGGGGGRGGGARVNIGGGFNGPRSMSRPAPSRPPPSRPADAGRRPGAGQLPATPPGTGVGQGPQPMPPVSGVRPSDPGRLRSPERPPDAQKPRPEQPICKPPSCIANPPDRPVRPDRPPGYYPDYPDYYPPYWGYHPGYWPPPYPAYDDDYPPPPPPAQATVPGTIAGSLPGDCRDVAVAGNNYKLCGATWYAPRFSGNQLVYVIVDPPT